MAKFGGGVIAALLIFCGIAQAETLKCENVKNYKGGGSEEHSLSLELTDGRVTGISYSNMTSNGKEGGAYSCELSLSDGSSKSKWVRVGNKIRAVDKEPEEESFAEIEVLPDGNYKVSLEKVSHYHCGFGAEFPSYLILKRSVKKCEIKK